MFNTGTPGWDAPWVLPAALCVLAAVVLAITGYLILVSRRDQDEDGADRSHYGDRISERLADTDVRKAYPLTPLPPRAAAYRSPPQVPRIAPDIPEQCWCGHGPRGHLPAYVSEVFRG